MPTITIENYTSNSLTFTCQDGQVRLYSISIKYGESIDEPVTPPEEPEQPTLYTLTITTDPADATVVLNAGEETVNGKSIEVEENTTVTYTVSKDGYETVNGNITVTETTNLPITLEAKAGDPEQKDETPYTVKSNLSSTAAAVNLTGDNDANKYYNLDTSLFEIKGIKNTPQQNVGLNKDGTTRLYADKNNGDGNTLSIKVLSGKISRIEIEFSNTVGSFTVNGDAGSKETSEYSIDSDTVLIQNVHTGTTTQVHIKSIIVYVVN